jgi:hypothetical protein
MASGINLADHVKATNFPALQIGAQDLAALHKFTATIPL